MVQLSHPYMTTGKTMALTKWTFVNKVMSLLFKYVVQVGHSFSSKEQESFNFMAEVTVCSDIGAQGNKICHCFHCFPICCNEVMEPDAMILVFWMLSFKPTFSLSSFTFIKRFLVCLPFLPLKWYHLHIWGYWYFSWQSWFQLESHPAWHFT